MDGGGGGARKLVGRVRDALVPTRETVSKQVGKQVVIPGVSSGIG